MDEIDDTLLQKWSELKAKERKYRALFNSRNDYDYLTYSHNVENELEKIEKMLATIEEDL